MKTTILHLILSFFIIESFGQTQLFESYNFNNGGYYILGLQARIDQTDRAKGPLYRMGNFYLKDTIVLNKIKKEWVFTKPGKRYACGYNYNMFLCKNGIVLKRFSINLNCNEIVFDEGYFYFDSEKLKMFLKSKRKSPLIKQKDFENINEARKYRDSVLRDDSLIMVPTPRWTKFEGEFDFTYKCDKIKNTCYEKEDSLINVMRYEITRNYPDEEFELSDRGGSLSEILQTIYCNKSLSDKFNLYYRDKESYFGQWKPFRLSLTTYWVKR